MIEMAKCRCGGWLSIDVGRNGETVERCACGYRAALRGRADPEAERTMDEMFARERAAKQRALGLPRCAWKQCREHVATARTDLCSRHCGERRKMKARQHYHDAQRDKNVA